MIDSTGLKVLGEGEWKVRKHGKERHCIRRKLHRAVDAKTHEVICADLSLNNVTDSEAFPGLIRQTHRKIRSAADGTYDTRLYHDELCRRKISALIPPRKGAGYWSGEYAYRNRAVVYQQFSGSNVWWEWITDYNHRTMEKTAMYRMKPLFGGSLTLRSLFKILCKCLFSEVTVQAVTELDNKAAHCHSPVLQRHRPFLGRRLDCQPHHFFHRVVCREHFTLFDRMADHAV